MEDAFHCNFDSVVVRVDRFWVMRPPGAGWRRLSGGQEGFDIGLYPEPAEPLFDNLVSAGEDRLRDGEAERLGGL